MEEEVEIIAEEKPASDATVTQSNSTDSIITM
jgi:hypothetical protein